MVSLDSFVNSKINFLSPRANSVGLGLYGNNRKQFVTGVTKYRKLFQSFPVKKNATIGIIHTLNFEYFCIIYAAVSLGYNLIVLDQKFNNQSCHKGFLPLDFVVFDRLLEDTASNNLYWRTNARYQIDTTILDIVDLYQHTETLNLSMDFDFTHCSMLSSSTSGTVSEPKLVSHSYEYLLALAQRNAEVLHFSGRVAHFKNLHHGSSLPVFFLPSTVACDYHVCLPWKDIIGSPHNKQIYNYTASLDINHLMFYRTDMLLDFLKHVLIEGLTFSDLTVYTLYYVDKDLHQYIKGKNIKIVSIFGCTETSGPIMINTLTNQNVDQFDPHVFYLLDDFFKVTIMPDGTRVQSQNGLVDHVIHDKFEQIGTATFRHLGRSDFFRINDTQISPEGLEQILVELKIPGHVVIDLPKQQLYLAVWDRSDLDSQLESVNKKLSAVYLTNGLTIKHAANLNKNDFMSGIKLNQEQLRSFFRTVH